MLATAVPLPLAGSAFKSLVTAENSTGADGAVVLKTFAQGDTSTVPSKLNRDMLAVELLGRFGCGVYAVANGLTLSTAASLTLPIAAGQAIMDGPVQPTATTLVVTDNIALVFVWLKQDGTFVSVNNSITPPAGTVMYIGCCTTSGGAITSVSHDGVLYCKGGLPYRITTDPAAPGDTPAANVIHLCKTSGGTYLWDGSAYKSAGSVLVTVEAVTADGTETSADYYKLVTNEGTTVKPIRTLPTAVAGIERRYVVQDSDGLRVKAAAGDTIRDVGTVSGVAGYIESTTVGSTLHLVAINATEWIVFAKTGTWTVT